MGINDFETGFEAELPEAAWQRAEALYFDAGEPSQLTREEVIARDGAIWTAAYFDVDKAITMVVLLRASGRKLTSFALNTALRKVDVIKTDLREGIMSCGESAQLQKSVGMTIPTGDDLEPLIDFLLPND